MLGFDAFRQDLATSLLDCADRRRTTFASGQATEEDLKIIALLKRLADDVENVDLHVFLIFELMFTHKRLARRFVVEHENLLSQVGVSYRPASANEVVRWLARHATKDDQPNLSPVRKRSAIAVLPCRGGTSRSRRDASVKTASHPDLLLPIAGDFAAGFGIVAPILAVWEVGLGIGQWRERAMADGHATLPATIISAEPNAGVRTSALSTKTVLSFRPPGSANTCRVPVQISQFAEQPMAGKTIMVVPQSTDCEAPLIPAEIGDPLSTFVLATALMASGLAALNLWDWLARLGPYSAHRLYQKPWRRPRRTTIKL